jgi:hypothetical protein
MKMTCAPLLNGLPMLAATARNYMTVLVFFNMYVLISYNVVQSNTILCVCLGL